MGWKCARRAWAKRQGREGASSMFMITKFSGKKACSGRCGESSSRLDLVLKSLKHSGVRKGNKEKLNKRPRAARFLR